jgi:hypothetical protein
MNSSKDPVWILFITDIESGAAVRMLPPAAAAPADAVVEIPTGAAECS